MKTFSLLIILTIFISCNPVFSQGMKNAISAGDTVSNGVDNFLTALDDNTSTLKAYFNQVYTGDIYADDTVEVSTTADFSNSLIVLPFILFPLPDYGSKNAPNLYIRRYSITGATGTPNWLIRIWGY